MGRGSSFPFRVTNLFSSIGIDLIGLLPFLFNLFGERMLKGFAHAFPLLGRKSFPSGKFRFGLFPSVILPISELDIFFHSSCPFHSLSSHRQIVKSNEFVLVIGPFSSASNFAADDRANSLQFGQKFGLSFEALSLSTLLLSQVFPFHQIGSFCPCHWQEAWMAI